MKPSNIILTSRLGQIIGAVLLSLSSQAVFAQYIGGVGAVPGLTNAPALPLVQGIGAGSLGSNLGATLATPTGITSIGATSAVTTAAGAGATATGAASVATGAAGAAGAVGATAAAVGGLSTLAIVGGVVVVGGAIAVAASGGGGSGTTGTVAPK
jgi:hypothetical protein